MHQNLLGQAELTKVAVNRGVGSNGWAPRCGLVLADLSFVGLSLFLGRGIFPIFVRGFSRIVLFLLVGLPSAPTRNIPERVRNTIRTFPAKDGRLPRFGKPLSLPSPLNLQKTNTQGKRGDVIPTHLHSPSPLKNFPPTITGGWRHALHRFILAGGPLQPRQHLLSQLLPAGPHTHRGSGDRSGEKRT